MGIIAYELGSFFPTAMERALALSQLRETGSPPPSFCERWPALAPIVRDCLNASPAARPSARQLLERLPPRVEDEVCV